MKTTKKGIEAELFKLLDFVREGMNQGRARRREKGGIPCGGHGIGLNIFTY
ncbi:MAG: hypothetical protein NT157_06915 [Candidatus Micrarchaeota archaeon]|nr:hypothetical protein [Candidatus Micrarchaeota archaeon]